MECGMSDLRSGESSGNKNLENEIASILEGVERSARSKNRPSQLCLLLATPFLLVSGYPLLDNILIQYCLFWTGGMLLSLAMYMYTPRKPTRPKNTTSVASSKSRLHRVK
jgi:hypothetical protein